MAFETIQFSVDDQGVARLVLNRPDRLNAIGYDIRLKAVVADDVVELARVLDGALAWADLIVITGGLGPTEDDLTRDAAKKGAKLVLFPEAFVSAYPRGLDFGAVVGSRTDLEVFETVAAATGYRNPPVYAPARSGEVQPH